MKKFFFNKKFRLIALVSVVIIGLFIYALSQTSPPIPTNVPAPAPEHSFDPSITLSPRPYFLRPIANSSPANSVSWETGTPFYISAHKIISLQKNESVSEFLQLEPATFIPLTNISVQQTEDKQYTLILGSEIIESPLTPDLSYSPFLDFRTEIKDLVVTIFNHKSNLELDKFEIPTNPIGISWSADQNLVALAFDNQVTLYEIPTKRKSIVVSPSKPLKILISPRNQFLAILSTNSLLINTLQTSQTWTSELNPNYKYNFTWTPLENLILVENQTDKRLDYVYKINPQDKSKIFLTNSQPIPSRLNISIPPTSSPQEEILLVDNKGQIWGISTTPPLTGRDLYQDHHLSTTSSEVR